MNEPTPTTAGDLLDVNVWLALAIEDHVHHAPASAYWREASGTTRYLCRLSAMSLVRLLTHAGLMSGTPLTLAGAWHVYERFRKLPGVAFIDEPGGVDAVLAAMLIPRLPLRLFTDAYFAAFARCAGLRLVTFDRDFARFQGLHLQRLSPADAR